LSTFCLAGLDTTFSPRDKITSLGHFRVKLSDKIHFASGWDQRLYDSFRRSAAGHLYTKFDLDERLAVVWDFSPIGVLSRGFGGNCLLLFFNFFSFVFPPAGLPLFPKPRQVQPQLKDGRFAR